MWQNTKTGLSLVRPVVHVTKYKDRSVPGMARRTCDKIQGQACPWYGPQYMGQNTKAGIPLLDLTVWMCICYLNMLYIRFPVALSFCIFRIQNIISGTKQKHWNKIILTSKSHTTVLSTSLGKMFFAWRLILNENVSFWLTISYQKLFVFSVLCFVLKYLP